MSENSNPNHRPINVVTFLAAHPNEVFSLAEIARQLGLSKGSAHRVMTALTETGFVSRHPRHKTYSLGMALVAIGQAALERYPGIDVARREMRRLTRELQVGCAASVMVNNEYLLLAREGVPQTYDGLTLVGERRYTVPPIGIGQMAWCSREAFESYLEPGKGYMSNEIRTHLSQACKVIRERGFAMAANGNGMRVVMQAAVAAIGHTPGEIPELPLPTPLPDLTPEEFQLLSFSDAGIRGVNYLSAPVFSSEEEICFEIVMSGFPSDLSTDTLQHYAERLVLAAETVTREIRGRKPKAW